MIIDVIDCLLCNASCCNMKHVSQLKIILYYVLMCSVADSNIQLYFIVQTLLTSAKIRRCLSFVQLTVIIMLN